MSVPSIVAEVMTADPIALHEEDDVWALQAEMQSLSLHHIPVVDGRKLVGLVSHQDMLRVTVSALRRDSLHGALDVQDKRGLFVADIMTRDVQTVQPNTPIARAARLLADAPFACLPVVEADGVLVGIVTAKDLMGVLADLLERAGD